MGLETVQEGNKVPEIQSLMLDVPALATEESRRVEPSPRLVDAVYNGVPVKIRVTETSSLAGPGLLYAKSVLELATKTFISLTARLEVTLQQAPSGGYTISTEIDNYDRAMKGLGRTLWETSLQLMTKFADTVHAPVVHKVRKKPSPEFGADRWDKMFLPLLEKYGYKKRPDKDIWEREYIPGGK
jgi:hypothetical protein